MNRISKEKRNQLILASMIVLVVLAGLYFTLIRFQQRKLEGWEAQKTTANNKLSEILDTVKNSQRIETDLIEVSNALAEQEAEMPNGDLYTSMRETIRQFKAGRKVDIPQFNSSGNSADMTMLPKFPYKQTSMTIVGTAYYHDLGKFIADFENDFATARVVSLEASPASASSPEEKEKLSFKIEIVSLVKGSPGITTTKL